MFGSFFVAGAFWPYGEPDPGALTTPWGTLLDVTEVMKMLLAWLFDGITDYDNLPVWSGFLANAFFCGHFDIYVVQKNSRRVRWFADAFGRAVLSYSTMSPSFTAKSSASIASIWRLNRALLASSATERCGQNNTHEFDDGPVAPDQGYHPRPWRCRPVTLNGFIETSVIAQQFALDSFPKGLSGYSLIRSMLMVHGYSADRSGEPNA